MASRVFSLRAPLLLQAAQWTGLSATRLFGSVSVSAVSGVNRCYSTKTADSLAEKREKAMLGGGQARIDKQHKNVCVCLSC